MTTALIRESTLTCPFCGRRRREQMPINSCRIIYFCTACGRTLRPKIGDCCVFCSYGSAPCPPIQIHRASARAQEQSPALADPLSSPAEEGA